MRVLAALSVLVLVLFFASLLVGPAGLGLGESLTALFTGKGEAVVLVMRDIRLPRALLVLSFTAINLPLDIDVFGVEVVGIFSSEYCPRSLAGSGSRGMVVLTITGQRIRN